MAFLRFVLKEQIEVELTSCRLWGTQVVNATCTVRRLNWLLKSSDLEQSWPLGVVHTLTNFSRTRTVTIFVYIDLYESSWIGIKTTMFLYPYFYVVFYQCLIGACLTTSSRCDSKLIRTTWYWSVPHAILPWSKSHRSHFPLTFLH